MPMQDQENMNVPIEMQVHVPENVSIQAEEVMKIILIIIIDHVIARYN